MTIFDIVNSITFTKEDLSDHPDFEKTYNKFMINRLLGQNPDLVALVCVLNDFKLPNKAHYQFYMKTVHKKKRYVKYVKPKEVLHLDLIKKYYGVGNVKAIDYLKLLSEEQINKIEQSFKYGKVG